MSMNNLCPSGLAQCVWDTGLSIIDLIVILALMGFSWGGKDSE